MKTISVTVPAKFADNLPDDIEPMFQQFLEEFLEEYFEYREDSKLRERLQKNPRIHALINDLTQAV